MDTEEPSYPRSRGTFFGPVRPPQPDDDSALSSGDAARDPKKVRKEIRLGAFGFVVLSLAALAFAVTRHLALARDGGAAVSKIAIAVGMFVSWGLVVTGLFMSFALWHDLPPRTPRSSAPMWFAGAILVLIVGGDLLERMGLIDGVASSVWTAFAFFGLGIYLLLAALSVSGLPWRGKVPVVVALLVGAAAWTPVSLVAVGAISIDATIERPLLFLACGAMVVAFVGLSIGGFRTAALANDQDLR